jgi:hypothetical protein
LLIERVSWASGFLLVAAFVSLVIAVFRRGLLTFWLHNYPVVVFGWALIAALLSEDTSATGEHKPTNHRRQEFLSQVEHLNFRPPHELLKRAWEGEESRRPSSSKNDARNKIVESLSGRDTHSTSGAPYRTVSHRIVQQNIGFSDHSKGLTLHSHA